MQGRKPNTFAPRWLRPLLLQRWVGQAIAARLAWLDAHPHARRYRYGVESEPRWFDAAWASYERDILADFNEAMLLWIFGMEVERLLRIAEEHPSFVGQVEWTRAVLGASEHLAQLYAELKRRHSWQQARAMLRAELRRFVDGNGCVDAWWVCCSSEG